MAGPQSPAPANEAPGEMKTPGVDAMRAYLQSLQTRITDAVSAIDGTPFLEDAWRKAAHEPLQGEGITRILEATPVPVVPLALRGLWGSFFSRIDGRAMSQLSRLRPLRKIALVAGDAVAPERASPEALQQTVLSLRGDWR